MPAGWPNALSSLAGTKVRVPLPLSLPSHRGIVALTGSRPLREDKRTDRVQAPYGPARTTGAERKPARGCRHFREGGPAHSGPGTRPRPASGSEGPETASKRRSRACWELPNLRPEGLLSCFARAPTLPRGRWACETAVARVSTTPTGVLCCSQSAPAFLLSAEGEVWAGHRWRYAAAKFLGLEELYGRG